MIYATYRFVNVERGLNRVAVACCVGVPTVAIKYDLRVLLIRVCDYCMFDCVHEIIAISQLDIVRPRHDMHNVSPIVALY